MDNIYYGIKKPMQEKKKKNMGKVVERGIYSPSSDFDRRPPMGGVTYVGPGKLEKRRTGTSKGTKQKKKHVSSGRGQ